MTALVDLVSAADRERLERRLAELREVEQLVREIPAQRPPGPPLSLAEISTTSTTQSGSGTPTSPAATHRPSGN